MEIDLFEIPIVPAPANPDTRIVEMKAAEAKASGGENDDFWAIKGSMDEALRRTVEDRRREKEIEELAAKAEKAARPIQLATFEL